MTDLLRVEVFEPDGDTLIAEVPRRDMVTWLVEKGTPGTGSFRIHLDDPILTDHPTLLAERNVVVFTRIADEWEEKRWRIEAHTPVTISAEEQAGRRTTVSGRGLIAGAQQAQVAPLHTDTLLFPQVRAFNYASPDPLEDWSDPDTWDIPEGVRWDEDPNRRSYPRAQSDAAAKWIWSTDPTENAELGPNWFQGRWTAAEAHEFIIQCTGDNFLEVWLDGVPIIYGDPTDPYNWRELFEYTATLAVGEHVIAARVENSGLHAGTNNPAAFICSVAKYYDDTGYIGDVVLRTGTTGSGWLVRGYGDPPGWTVGDILLKLFGEAKLRGVINLQDLTFGFTGTHDSLGTPWPGELSQDTTFAIGMDLMKVLDQIGETAADVWMDGNVLHAVPRRGTDRSGTVVFADGENVLAGAPTMKSSGAANAALIRYGKRYMWVLDEASIDDIGRREVFLNLSDVTDPTQATKQAMALFAETAEVEITIPLQVSSADGPLFGADWYLCDTVAGPGLFAEPTTLRVYSVAGSEQEGHLLYDLDCYPEAVGEDTPAGSKLAPSQRENRLHRQVEALGLGNGRGRLTAPRLAPNTEPTVAAAHPVEIPFSMAGSASDVVSPPKQLKTAAGIHSIDFAAGQVASTDSTATVYVDGTSIGTVDLPAGDSYAIAYLSGVTGARGGFLTVAVTTPGTGLGDVVVTVDTAPVV